MSSNPSGSGPSTAAAVNSSPAGTPSSPSSMPSGQQASGIHMSSPMGTQPSSAGNTTAVFSNIIPNNPLYTVQYINDPAWPTELHLDPSILNWSEWSCCLRLLCKQQGLGVWLEHIIRQHVDSIYVKSHVQFYLCLHESPHGPTE